MSHAVRLAAKLALLLLLISPVPGFSTQATQAALVEVTIDAIETAPAGAPATDHLVTVEQVLQGSVPGTSLIVRVPREERAPELRTGERVRLSLIPGNDGSFRIRRVERAGQEPAAVGRTDQDLPVTVALTLPFQTLQTGEAVPFQAGFTGPARSARGEIGAGALAFSDGPCAAETFCAHHIFTRPGTYRIRVTATGLQGQIAETTRTVFVEGDEVRLTGRESLLQNVLSAPGGAQSDLRLYNAGEVPVLVRATFVPRGASAGVREVTVSPGTSVFLPDVVAGLFGQRDQQGSLSLYYLLSLPDSDARPLVFAYSRSAADSADPAGASFGQHIPEEPESGWSAAERIAPGILEGNGFVSTLSAVNLEGVRGQVTVSLRDEDGELVGEPAVLTLGPRNLRLQAVSRMFPAVVGRRGPFTAHFTSNGISFTASTTLLEIESQDQIFIPAAPVDAGSPEKAGGTAATTTGDLFFPRVVRGPGPFDTFQTSRLTAFNPTDQGRLLTVEFWERGHDNLAPRTAYRYVEPGRSLLVNDILLDLFGVEAGIGALRITWSGPAGPAPRVLSVMASGTAGTAGGLFGSQGKRFGTLVDAVTEASAIRSRGIDFGAEQNPASRSSFGAVNLASAGTTLRLTLRDAAGHVLAGTQVGLEPRQHLERNVAGLFPGIGNGRSWAIETEVVSGGPVFTYLAQIKAGGDLDYTFGHPK